jgi:cell fate regulator YaaT (PSP1 superfamily)
MIFQVEITPFRLELVKWDVNCRSGERVIFKSKEGTDTGRVIRFLPCLTEEETCYGEIIRSATAEDAEKIEELREYEEFCMIELKRAIQEFSILMKPVYTHCQFDEERLVFYFTAEKKVEFRKLHRFISQKLNKRVVIKQIGSRDFTRIFGGVGVCGRNLCCATFLADLKSISLRMAREQKLYVSPSKLSGICGKLLCCLNFEEDYYTDFQNDKAVKETADDDATEAGEEPVIY